MFTYKRRIPPLLIIDGTTIAPAFVLAGRTRRRDQKRQEQIDLHAWESEGGNPALRNAPMQRSLFAEAPEGDTLNPSSEAQPND